MTKLIADNATENFNFITGTGTDFASQVSASASTYSWLNVDGDLITATGSFTYGVGGAVSGTVTSLAIDLSNNGSNDIDIGEIPNVDINLLFDSDTFWSSMFGADDVLSGPEAVTGILTGDAPDAANGAVGGDDEISANVTVPPGSMTGDFRVVGNLRSAAGGDDVFTLTGSFSGSSRFFGDVVELFGMLTGGDDQFSNTAGAMSAFGDAQRVGESNLGYFGDLIGGNDVMVGVATGYGEAEIMYWGSIVGGNDTITGREIYLDNLYGDMKTIASSNVIGATFHGGNDTLNGLGGGDFLYGDLREIEAGASLTDILFGDDTIRGGTGNDQIWGDYRDDFAGLLDSEDGGDDSIFGEDGDDTIYANGGNDTVVGGTGSDTMDGGGGIDLLSYVGSVAGVTINLATGAASGGDATGDSFSNFENVLGSALADDLTGSTGVNVLSGGDGVDILRGGDGNDTLNGDDGNDFLYGQNDDDTLNGGDGNDTLNGQAGADIMTGGTGNDTYFLDNAGDVVNEPIGTGVDTTDTVITSVNFRQDLMTSARGVEYITVTGTANVTIIAMETFNVITGNSGNNYIAAYGGNDTINAGDGTDFVFGGEGRDQMTGGLGNDTFYFAFVADSGGTINRRDTITDFSQVAGNDDVIDLRALDAISFNVGLDQFTWIDTAAFSGAHGELRYTYDAINNLTLIEGNTFGDTLPEFQLALVGNYTLTAGAAGAGHDILIA